MVLSLLLFAQVMGQGFDRSLEQLERQQIITPAERRRVQLGAPASAPSSSLVRLCQRGDGAVSRRECIGGGSNALRVPVSARLGGGGGSFSLDQVLRVTPRPAAVAGNGNRSLLFPLIGAAFTSSGFGWRQHPVLGRLMLHAGRDLAEIGRAHV